MQLTRTETIEDFGGYLCGRLHCRSNQFKYTGDCKTKLM